jgi:hypothetical protein
MVLVLPDLTLRPVPRHAIEILDTSGDGERTALRVTTDLDGRGEVSLPPGQYWVKVSEPVLFEGTQYLWDIALVVGKGQADATVELSNDNSIHAAAEVKSPHLSLEGKVFQDCKDGIVTVESEFGHGSGFVVDPSGLIVTNAHVVERSRDFAVAFDNSHRFVAETLAVDGENDVAVLRFNPTGYPSLHILQLATAEDTDSEKVGDPVLAIGSPLNQEKILSRGIISKVESRAIMSDININHGNSGGPLLDMNGRVIGITTFKDLDPTGGGVSGIIRIGVADPLLGQAREVAKQRPLPDAAALPPIPNEPYPLADLKTQIKSQKFDPSNYGARSSTFDVQFITPALKYFLETKSEAEKADIRAKKLAKAGATTESQDADPYSNLKAWRSQLGDYLPVVEIYVLPRLKATGGSIFGAMMSGNASVLHYRYKSDFDSAELMVDGKPVMPLRRSRFAKDANFVSLNGYAKDSGYAGAYLFGVEFLKDLRADSKVSLVIHDGLKPGKAVVLEIDPMLVWSIRNDFSPMLGPPPFPAPEQTVSGASAAS